MSKPNPICGEKGCIGYMQYTGPNNEYLKCPSCGFQKKVSKRIIKVLKGIKNDNN